MQEISADTSWLLLCEESHHYRRQNLKLQFGGVFKERHIGHREAPGACWEVKPKPRPEPLVLRWQALLFSQHSQL